VQYKRAEWALQEQIAKRKAGRKLAVIFDIDETSLSSYCEMQRENYGFVKSLNDEWIVSPQAAVAIPGALRLFNRAKAAGVDVFFITGRPVSQTDGTTRNLEAAGFHGWKHLDLRDPSESGLTRAEYKAGRRKRIVADGYRLILNVGDQWSDLNGEPKAEVSVKLPNPFYFLP
jgi:predicted secreted acid phosphatase